MAELAAAISAAAGAISAGASIAGTTTSALVDSSGYNVACGIEVENYTKWPMVKPRVFPAWGLVKIPPSDILPAKREVMVVHKSGGTATGTSGTVSWLINDVRVIIMWSVPFNQDHHYNRMGLSITPKKDHDDKVFQIMYDGTLDPNTFVRGEYYSNSKTIKFSTRMITVEGIMGSSHKCEIKVKVKPRRKEDFAAKILK